MKKLTNFLIKLKPYKRIYKMFWLVLIILILFLFQIFMLSISYAVSHNVGAFNYWFKGIYFMLFVSRSEPNSAQGFIFATSVIGIIPLILLIPMLYFTFANWFIQEKLSDKFINIEEDKYLYWSKYFHYLIIGVLFSIINGSLSYCAKGGFNPIKACASIYLVSSESFSQRLGAYCSILYLFIGLTYIAFVFIWSLKIAICWVFKKIALLIEKCNEYFRKIRERKRELKLKKLEEKANKKNKQKE